MKITKKQMTPGARVQPGKSRDMDSLEERWLRRWESHLSTAAEGGKFWRPERDSPVNVCFSPQRQFCLPGDSHPFDFAFPEWLIVIEIQGGQHMDKSGHTNAAGQNRDALKTRLAAERGWRVMTWTTDDIVHDRGFEQLARALGIIGGVA
jgi:very-short-patch-repair endonuclease